MHSRIALVILRKDLADALRNGRIAAAIAFPIVFSLFFARLIGTGASGGAPSGGGDTPRYGVFASGPSRLLESLSSLPQLTFQRAESLDQLRDAVRKGDLQAGVVIPEDLDAALNGGRSAELQIIVKDSAAKGAPVEEVVTEQLRALRGYTPPVKVAIDTVRQPTPVRGTDKSDSLAMWLVMALAMVGSYVVPVVMAEEKEKRTLDAVMVARASYLDVVLAKAGLGMVYALTASVLVLALNNGLVGNVPVLLLAQLLGALVVVEIGLLLGGLLTDMTSVTTWSSMVSLALLIPGMFRTFLTSGLVHGGVLLMVSRAVPTHYVLDLASLAMADQAGLSAIWVDIVVLAGCAAALLAANVRALRRREA